MTLFPLILLMLPTASLAFQAPAFSVHQRFSSIGTDDRAPRAAASSSSATMTTRESSSNTKTKRGLKYRNGDIEEFLHQRLGTQPLGDETYPGSSSSNSHVNNRWWKGLFPGHCRYYGTISPTSLDAASEETSQRVDEYLKFLDKRYNQIRESELQQSFAKNKKQGTPNAAAFYPRPLMQDQELPAPKPAVPMKQATPAPESQQLDQPKNILSRNRSFWAVIGVLLLKQQNKLPQVKELLADVSLESMVSVAVKRIPEVPMLALRMSGGWHVAALIMSLATALISRLRSVVPFAQ